MTAHISLYSPLHDTNPVSTTQSRTRPLSLDRRHGGHLIALFIPAYRFSSTVLLESKAAGEKRGAILRTGSLLMNKPTTLAQHIGILSPFTSCSIGVTTRRLHENSIRKPRLQFRASCIASRRVDLVKASRSRGYGETILSRKDVVT